ncbi:MAG: 1-aminocyclopropane-1-carboxylate deaminase/D-cysteine desulfhydrase [Melioribacteraceae bacterium]|nr:1-aminocyclopropane-1-carboxylate deaminase/D-cysteine desulfhydrase [Melioribacteraceae bacterium]
MRVKMAGDVNYGISAEMSFPDESKAATQEIRMPEPVNDVKVYLNRIDLVHQQISGNKWFKLKYNLQLARQLGFDKLLTFGGAYSNHIAATAAAGKLYGFRTIGIIRGEQHLPLNPTLDFVVEQKMEIHYYSRAFFRTRNTLEFFDNIRKRFGKDVYILPEGGTNELAVKGCSEIPGMIDSEYDYLCTACGTGGTISGLIAGSEKKKIIGFSALKGGDFLIRDVENLLMKSTGKKFNNWIINTDYHCGGYAKVNDELLSFKEKFESINGIELDYIYTVKMLYGIQDMIIKRQFESGSKVVAIHTGGIQGNVGMRMRLHPTGFIKQ